jgi:hypothetical protein
VSGCDLDRAVIPAPTMRAAAAAAAGGGIVLCWVAAVVGAAVVLYGRPMRRDG